MRIIFLNDTIFLQPRNFFFPIFFLPFCFFSSRLLLLSTFLPISSFSFHFLLYSIDIGNSVVRINPLCNPPASRFEIFGTSSYLVAIILVDVQVRLSIRNATPLPEKRKIHRSNDRSKFRQPIQPRAIVIERSPRRFSEQCARVQYRAPHTRHQIFTQW